MWYLDRVTNYDYSAFNSDFRLITASNNLETAILSFGVFLHYFKFTCIRKEALFTM